MIIADTAGMLLAGAMHTQRTIRTLIDWTSSTMEATGQPPDTFKAFIEDATALLGDLQQEWVEHNSIRMIREGLYEYVSLPAPLPPPCL